MLMPCIFTNYNMFKQGVGTCPFYRESKTQSPGQTFPLRQLMDNCDWQLKKGLNWLNRSSNALLLVRTVKPAISKSTLKTTRLLEQPNWQRRMNKDNLNFLKIAKRQHFVTTIDKQIKNN